MKITESEYLEAKKIVEKYEEQLKEPPEMFICPDCGGEFIYDPNFWLCADCREKRGQKMLNK